MSDRVSGSSMEHKISKSIEEQNVIMDNKMDYYLSKINILEENLNRERKLKAGFKVIISNFSSENKMLRAKILNKHKKKLEKKAEQKMQDKQINRTTSPIRKCMDDENIFSEDHIIKQKLTSSQLSSTCKHDEVVGLFDSPRSCFIDEKFVSEDIKRCQCDKHHEESELLATINELTLKLKESDTKEKLTEERCEMLMIQMETYKADFVAERSDRENAMGRLMEVEKELANLKRMSEDRRFTFQNSHPLIGCGASPSFLDPNFHPPTLIDDILIARGDSFSALQETTTPEHTNLKKGTSTVRKKNKSYGTDDTNMSSSESLNLLTTELGGDDYYH